MKPSCLYWSRVADRLALSGQAPEPGSAAARHLERCAGCRTLFHGQQELAQELRGPWSPPRPADGFTQQVWQRVDSRDRRPTAWRWPAAAAATGAVMAAVVLARPVYHRLPAPVISQGSTEPANPVAPTAAVGSSENPEPGSGHQQAPGNRSVRGSRTGEESRDPAPGTPRVAHVLPGGGTRTVRAPAAVREDPDPAYLNGEEDGLTAHWVLGGAARLERPPVDVSGLRDDFVLLSPPRFAGGGRNARLKEDVRKEMAREAAVVDTRLFRKVTLQLKGASLDELCDGLEAQTGVQLRATRGVTDEKVTVFVKDQPARDVLRAVARLFGYLWARSGPEGAYRYELMQTLKAQLMEEELRNGDVNAALIALDEEFSAYAPLLEQPLEQLRARLAAAKGPERARLQGLLERGGWGGAKLYGLLTPAERAALVSGRSLEFTTESANPDRRIPAAMVPLLLETNTTPLELSADGIRVGRGSQRLADLAGAVPSISLRMNRSELGEITLETSLNATIPLANGGSVGTGATCTLGIGRSPSVARPQNAAANAAGRRDPALQRNAALRPQPVPVPEEAAPVGGRAGARLGRVTTAEVWEALHRETGLPIVADFYTRLYPVEPVTVEDAPLFEGLCRAADALGVRWRKDGAFILCRSTSYFWDKLKEVPNRHLRRWQQLRRENGGLPLQGLAEMASLTDAQLESDRIAEGIRHLWGLEEWHLVGGEGANCREYARFVGFLSPEQQQKSLTAQGLPFRELSPAQQQRFFRLLGPGLLDHPGAAPAALVSGGAFRAGYCPAGWFEWSPQPYGGRLPLVTARTAEAVLEQARAIDPKVSPGDVRKPGPDLRAECRLGDGTVTGRSRYSGWGGKY